MALQLKGLRANVNGLRADIDDLTSLAAGGRATAAVLKSHLGDIKTEIGQHVDDIEFTANVLGNSASGSEEPSNLSTTFRAEAERQAAEGHKP